jgi:hypothetical protein
MYRLSLGDFNAAVVKLLQLVRNTTICKGDSEGFRGQDAGSEQACIAMYKHAQGHVGDPSIFQAVRCWNFTAKTEFVSKTV